LVYKRYTTQDTTDHERLALRRHKGFWMALAAGAVSAIVLGVVLTRALRPSAVETDQTAANAANPPTGTRAPEPSAAAQPSLAPVVSPSPMRSPLVRPSPRLSPSESPLPTPAEPGHFTNADLERLKREEGVLPGSPAPRSSASPSRPSASASPAAKASPSPAARTASPAPSGSPPARPPRPAAAGEPLPDQPGEPGAESEESVWRARTQRRLVAVRAAEDRLRRAQERVSTLREQTTAALAEGADRAAGLQQQLQQAEDRLDQAERDLQRAEEALDRLDDEARRAGVPLAWVRHP
jgi:hypothetical protein